jgi:hypothetical protein
MLSRTFIETQFPIATISANSYKGTTYKGPNKGTGLLSGPFIGSAMVEIFAHYRRFLAHGGDL